MLGARNFVVFEIGAIGCLPVMLNTPQPMPPKTRCLDQVNSWYLFTMPSLLRSSMNYAPSLKGSKFVLAKAFGFTPGSFLHTMVSLLCLIFSQICLFAENMLENVRSKNANSYSVTN